MNKSRRTCNLVFDLDGTLIDSAPDILSALVSAAQAAGLPACPPPQKEVIGPPVSGMIKRWGVPHSEAQAIELVRAFREIYDANPMNGTKPYPHVLDMLASLQLSGMGIWVATNKPIVPTTVLINRWFSPFINGWICVDSLPGIKMSKEQMLTRLAGLHTFFPDNSWMIGDSPGDIQAGQNMGWKTIAVLYGYGIEQEMRKLRSDAYVTKASEIPAALGL